MNKHMVVKLDHATRRALLNFLQVSGDGRSVEQIVDLAVKGWLADAVRADPAAAIAASHGYQWKSLFLPEGTLLRACYHGEYFTAQVIGDAIQYHGREYSPRQLLMHITGGVRNAWLELWVRCPGDVRWHLADTRRRILRRDLALAPAGARRNRALTAGACAVQPVESPAQAQSAEPPAQAQSAELPAQTQSAEPPAQAQSAEPPAQALSAETTPEGIPSWIVERAAKRRHYLRRTDIVCAEQPDLSLNLPSGRGYGAHGAGRSGPRDRRTTAFPWPAAHAPRTD